MAPVTGKVMYQGQPVTAGTIMFTPIGSGEMTPGKPAGGKIQEDGTFSLMSYNPGDGAKIGPCRVTFSPPQVSTGRNINGLMPKEREVEVTEGKNDITIELVKS
ncbi:hypothetical protein DSM3645_25287 [Blastopirellula marina DSM 3645]|uniref:Uncharacterized protein n=2 Tax=Blastopirellula marina TaxID=124 RepID=A4A0C5_9BACT|nr:hypothetical protein DSM3645_25287 [Blastopirellula marina DSM 3645]